MTEVTQIVTREDKFIEAMRPQFQNRVPLGIEDWYASKQDHVLLIAEKASERYWKSIGDMIYTSLKNPLYKEKCVVGFENKDGLAKASDRYRGKTDTSSLDIATWDQIKESALDDGKFSRELELEFIRGVKVAAEESGHSFVRVINEECSQLACEVTNPKEFFAWECKMGSSYRRTFGNTPYMQVCVYRIDLLSKHHANYREIVTRMLDAHDTIVYIDGSEAYFNRAAMRHIFKKHGNNRLHQVWIHLKKSVHWQLQRLRGWRPETPPALTGKSVIVPLK